MFGQMTSAARTWCRQTALAPIARTRSGHDAETAAGGKRLHIGLNLLAGGVLRDCGRAGCSGFWRGGGGGWARAGAPYTHIHHQSLWRERGAGFRRQNGGDEFLLSGCNAAGEPDAAARVVVSWAVPVRASQKDAGLCLTTV